MDRPEIKKNDWVIMRSFAEDPGIEARIFRVEEDGTAFVGYWDHSIRATKGYAAWNGEYWHAIDRPVIGLQSKKDELIKKNKL